MDLDADVNRHCMAKMFEFLDKHLDLAPVNPAKKDEP
jgi:hypothetical protein